jgi:hypothetical protein
LVKQKIFLISFKQAVCGKFALQFSDEFVGNSQVGIFGIRSTVLVVGDNQNKPLRAIQSI